ncbi:MAG: acetyltransferase [Pseudolysinimonas sp.]
MSADRVIMLGASGHARVLCETLSLAQVELSGFIAPDDDSRLAGVPHLGGDEALADLDVAHTVLVNGVGSVASPTHRAEIYDAAVARGFRFLEVRDPSALVRPGAVLGAGVQVLAGAIVNSGATLGDDVIVNSGAIVEHDCRLGDHVHVSPGAVLGGDVTVGAQTHVGLGARVLQGVTIGAGCTIGAGAVVTRDVADGMVAVGVPAVSRPPSGHDS